MRPTPSLLLGVLLAATVARADPVPVAHPAPALPEPPVARVPVPGPAETQGDALVPWARAPGLDVYRITFTGGEPAMVALAGDGATRPALHVFDADGAEVCTAESSDEAEVCRWMPASTAAFFVAVRNRGSDAHRYRLWTN